MLFKQIRKLPYEVLFTFWVSHNIYVFVASEARDLLSDAVHFHCLGTHTQMASFDMYLIPGESGGEGMGWEESRFFVAYLLPDA